MAQSQILCEMKESRPGSSDVELELKGCGLGNEKSFTTEINGNENNGSNGGKNNPNPNQVQILTSGKKRRILRSYGGMCLAFLTSFLFSMDILLAKVLQRYGFYAENSAFYRYVASPFLSLMFIGFYECRGKFDTSKKNKIFESIWPLNDPERRKTLLGVVIQGILAPAAVILRHFAVEYITIGDASVISSSTPILVSVLAHFILGEKTGVVPFLTPVVALLGVMFISKPPIFTGAEGFDTNTLIGMAFASGSLICGSAAVITMRQQKQVHFTLMLLIRSIFGMGEAYAVSQISTRGFSVPHEFYASIMLAALAILSFTNQMFFNLALQMETAALVSLVTTSDSIFTYLSQYVFLGVVPDFYSGVGGAIISLCILTMGFRKFLMEEPSESRCRKPCFFLLY